MPNFGKFLSGESCYLQLAVSIFASQSELRHLQSKVSVCVCVYVCLHMILGQMPTQSELRNLQCVVSVCVCVLACDFGLNAQFR